MLELKGKTALITGSSRSIGKAIALELAHLGADIVLHCVSKRITAEDVRREILAMGRKAFVVQADLRELDCADKIWEAVREEVNRIDILILNASMQSRKPWLDVTPENFNEQINCNLRSTLMLIQKFAPGMGANKWGRIITIGSVHEAKPNPDMIVYAASKAAQTLMAKSLAGKLARDGVTVNCVAPGVILTDRNKTALQQKEWHDHVVAKIPMGKFGEPADCAGIVAALCSETGRYITGQNIFVDGGFGVF
ncbi:MAG: SDR family oxidoreductase [Victivallales bacterium]|nr:SDR family oxidoreductase [Victivallales bacterium]